MATLTVMLATHISKSGLRAIVIRATEGQHRVQIPTGWKVRPTDWDGRKVLKSHPDHRLINAAIESKKSELLKKIFDSELNGKPLRLELLNKPHSTHSFTDYLKKRAKDYGARKKIIMGKKLDRFIKELSLCFEGDVYFEDIDTDWIRTLDTWLIEQKNVANTRFRKLKFFRGFFGNAIDEGKADPPNPFKSYKISPEPVNKMKLSTAQIKEIEKLDLSGAIDLARDMFLFSFYCKGIRFEEVMKIKKEDIHDSRVYWQSGKGKKWLSTEIHPRLAKIIDKYSDGETLFPIKENTGSANAIVNLNLKIVGGLIGVKGLTFHIARHSLAFALKETSQSIHVIKDVLGHSDTRTTEIYLKSLGDEYLDAEMRKVYDY